MAQSGAALTPSGWLEGERACLNPHLAHGYQHTVAEIAQSVIDAGLSLTTIREYPYSNGFRVNERFVDIGGRRYAPPVPISLPVMLGVVATR